MTQHLRIIPLEYDPDLPGDLFGNILRDLFSINDSKKRSYDMLYRYYALGGQNKLTLEQLGIIHTITRERVRQVLSKSLKDIKALITKGECKSAQAVLHPSLIQTFQSYATFFGVNQMYSETEIIQKTQKHFQILEVNVPVVRLILRLYEYQPIDTGSADTITWVSKDIDANRLEFALANVFRYLRETCTAKSREEIILGINTNYPQNERFKMSEITRALDLHDDIEQLENNLYQIKFDNLSSLDDKAYRILHEHKSPMHARDLVRLLNKREAQTGRSGISQQHIASRMSADARFQNIGRSGEWFLTEFAKPSEISTKYIVPLMEEALHAEGDSLTEQQIFDYVRARRPVEKTSIGIYLSTHRSFVKVEGGYSLAAWKPEPAKKVRRIRQRLDVAKLAENIELVFKDREVGEMPLTDLTKEIVPLYEGVSENRFSAYWLPISPAIQVIERTEQGRKRRIAVFNPNYKAHLKSENLPVMRTIQKTVREILSKQPDKRMKMSRLRDQVVNQLNCPKASVYSALNQMPDIDKVGNAKEKYCVLRDTEQLYNEYVNQLTDPHRISLVKRAIGMINVEYVDLALFDLGRIFEDTLKKLLLELESKNMLTSTPKSRVSDMRLNDLVILAEKEQITLSSAPLHYQRIHRNDRTHGVPSVEERQALLATCPTEVPYYLAYLVLLEQRLKQIT